MCALWLGMGTGLSPFLLRSLIAKQVWCLMLVLICDYCTVLIIQTIEQTRKINLCCLTHSLVFFFFFTRQEWEIFTIKSRKKKLHCHNWLRVSGQVLLRTICSSHCSTIPDHEHPANQNERCFTVSKKV